MPTMKDVARHAGVSTATVSRVLSTPEVCSEATRETVMASVEALGYAPNYAAKSLRTFRTDKIVVTVPDIANPFFSSVIRGVEAAAQAMGYAVLLGDTRHEAEREELYAGMLARREADGLIFLGHRLPPTLADLVARMGGRAPVVNGCEFSPELGVSSAHIDNAKAASEAMAYLYDLGHRHVGVVTGPLASPISRDRLEGVREAAKARSAEGKLTVAVGDFSIESGQEKAHALLSQPEPPTAIFCFGDEMAMGALGAIRDQGLSCPADVSVVGFDDIRYSRFVTPALTTISQPMEEIGRETVRLLQGVLTDQIKEPTSVTLAHSLVVRDSTAPVKS